MATNVNELSDRSPAPIYGGPDVDEIDEKILNILVEDGRISYADLGRRLMLTRTAVRDRVQNLLNKGVIERFTIVINPRKVGRHLSAFFEIDLDPPHLRSIATSLADNEYVLSVHQMTGPSTLHVHASLRDGEHLAEFLQDNLHSLPGITKVKTYVLLTSFKSKYGGIRIQ